MQAKDIAIATALDYTADGSISRERETRFNAPRQKKKFVEETIFFLEGGRAFSRFPFVATHQFLFSPLPYLHIR